MFLFQTNLVFIKMEQEFKLKYYGSMILVLKFNDWKPFLNLQFLQSTFP
jgi:hypothetical protein